MHKMKLLEIPELTKYFTTYSGISKILHNLFWVSSRKRKHRTKPLNIIGLTRHFITYSVVAHKKESAE